MIDVRLFSSEMENFVLVDTLTPNADDCFRHHQLDSTLHTSIRCRYMSCVYRFLCAQNASLHDLPTNNPHFENTHQEIHRMHIYIYVQCIYIYIHI